MIALVADIHITVIPFALGISKLGYASFGEDTEIVKTIDKRSLLNIESSIVDRADKSLPSWGIISNSGSISFKDIDGSFKDYAEANWLTKGKKVELFLINTLSKSRKKVGDFYTSDWDYDTETKEVFVSIKDDLMEWQEISAIGRVYPYAFATDGEGLTWYYNHLRSQTPEKYNMLSFEELDIDTQNALKGINQPFKIAQSASLWSSWTKLCEATGCYIYKNAIGKTIFRYGRGT